MKCFSINEGEAFILAEDEAEADSLIAEGEHGDYELAEISPVAPERFYAKAHRDYLLGLREQRLERER